jgi:hypothetical protein
VPDEVPRSRQIRAAAEQAHTAGTSEFEGGRIVTDVVSQRGAVTWMIFAVLWQDRTNSLNSWRMPWGRPTR